MLPGASAASAAGNIATSDPDADVWCSAAAGPNKESSAALLQGAALAATIAAVAATL